MDVLMEKQRRKRLASLPFSEKIKLVEELRRVSQTAGESGLRKQSLYDRVHMNSIDDPREA